MSTSIEQRIGLQESDPIFLYTCSLSENKLEMFFFGSFFKLCSKLQNI